MFSYHFQPFTKNYNKSKRINIEISIIGTGNVGSTLGRRWSQAGHKVTYGSRTPQQDRVQELVRETGNGSQAVPINEAMQASPLILLAVPWKAVENIITAAGDLTGKILIDPINVYPEGGDLSCAEQIAGWAKGAHVVKAFNITGTGNMENPDYGPESLTMFICGDDKEAKEKVASLAEEVGFEVLDVGGLNTAGYLEALARLWVHLAYQRGLGKDIGFKLLKR